MNVNLNHPSPFSLLLIAGALCLGALVFAVVALFLIFKDDWRFELTSLSVIVAVGAISILPASFIVPMFVSRSTARTLGRNMTPEQKKDATLVARSAANVYQSATIIRFALIEGAVFFLIVVSIIEKNFLPWCIAIALVALMVSQIPFRMRYDEAIDSISQHIRDARS